MKKLAIIAAVISVLATIMILLAYSIGESYGTLFANELAINQLNGGGTAYIALQNWYVLKNIISYIGYAMAAVTVILIIIIIFKVSKERNK